MSRQAKDGFEQNFGSMLDETESFRKPHPCFQRASILHFDSFVFFLTMLSTFFVVGQEVVQKCSGMNQSLLEFPISGAKTFPSSRGMSFLLTRFLCCGRGSGGAFLFRKHSTPRPLFHARSFA